MNRSIFFVVLFHSDHFFDFIRDGCEAFLPLELLMILGAAVWLGPLLRWGKSTEIRVSVHFIGLLDNPPITIFQGGDINRGCLTKIVVLSNVEIVVLDKCAGFCSFPNVDRL